METTYIQTPLGVAKLIADKKGIIEVTVDDEFKMGTSPVPTCLKATTKQLKEYFSGSRTTFDIAMNPKGTDFQKKVWDELVKIPFGKTISYLDLSKRLGNTKAIRAVAAANGKNPLWIIVPCHRVIGSDGSLTGYAVGIHRKKWLLEHESPAKQQSLF